MGPHFSDTLSHCMPCALPVQTGNGGARLRGRAGAWESAAAPPECPSVAVTGVYRSQRPSSEKCDSDVIVTVVRRKVQ